MDELTLSDVTALIPAKDEEEGIKLVIEELRKVGVSKIVVVDKSSDRTAEVAASLGARVIKQVGVGKADAVREGLREVSTPYVLVIDADGTYDASYVPKMLEHMSKYGYDEVIGARLSGRENIPPVNRFGNWLITKLFNLLFGTSLSDVCSGMYLVKTGIARELEFSSKGFSIEVEIAAHVASTTGRVGEVPINYRKRVGKAKLRVWHGLTIVKDAIKLAVRYNPAFLIFSVGAMIFLPSLAIASWVAWELIFRGSKHFVWALISTIGMGVGLVSGLLAVMALYIKRVELRITRKLRESRERVK